jgi:predicted enzyme related to lactoylglutathione lyase
MITASTLNVPNWVDLSTPHVSGAITFYTQLLGWTFELTSTPMGEYHVAKLGEREVGGLMAQAPEQSGTQPTWTMFIHVADVDEMTARAEAVGAAVLAEPFDIPDGRVAVVADPTGAMFALIANPSMPPDGAWFGTEPGAVCWVELLTRDPVRAERFYADAFGWKAETQVHGETSYTTFLLDGDPLGGMMMMPTQVPTEAPSHWSAYFAVEDCAATEARCVELGGRVLRPTTEIEMGEFAVLEDPDGAPFNVMEYAG